MINFDRTYRDRVRWSDEGQYGATPLSASNLNRGDISLQDHDRALAETIEIVNQTSNKISDYETFKTTVTNLINRIQSDLITKYATISALNSVKSDLTLETYRRELGDSDLDEEKIDKILAQRAVSRIDFIESESKFIFYRMNGLVAKEVDLNNEKIPVTFRLDGAVLKMYGENGQFLGSVDLSSLIQVNTFEDSSTIAWTKYTGSNRLKADVLDGSITESKLQPNFLNDCREQVRTATFQADRATEQANISTEQAAISTEAADKAERLIERITLADFYIDEDGCLICQKEYEDPSADRFSFAIINNDYLEVTVNG